MQLQALAFCYSRDVRPSILLSICHTLVLYQKIAQLVFRLTYFTDGKSNDSIFLGEKPGWSQNSIGVTPSSGDVAHGLRFCQYKAYADIRQGSLAC